MHDVQLVRSSTGAIIWAQTFTDAEQAMAFLDDLNTDLETLDTTAFRARHSVPASM